MSQQQIDRSSVDLTTDLTLAVIELNKSTLIPVGIGYGVLADCLTALEFVRERRAQI